MRCSDISLALEIELAGRAPAMDLFVVPTIPFRLLYGLLMMGHGRRQILWFGVTSHPTAEWIANHFTEAFGWEQAPQRLGSVAARSQFCSRHVS
jgi:hypothetical protein